MFNLLPRIMVVLFMLLQAPALLAQDTINMDSTGMPLREAIQFILRDRAVSLVTGEELNEMVTLKLKNVPWRDGLDSLLKAHGYKAIEEKGILLVFKREAGKEDDVNLMPLMLHFNHLPASSAKELLQPLLSKNGRIVLMSSGDLKGKSLSVIDRPAILDTIRSLVKALDVSPKNVKSEMSVLGDDRVSLTLENFAVANIAELWKTTLGINVFMHAQPIGYVNVNLANIRWQEALKLILREHQLGYQLEEDYIVIQPLSDMRKKMITKEFKLEHVDGWDLKPYLESMLSAEGKVACFSPAPRGGFEFGSKVSDPRTKTEAKGIRRSSVISVTDNSEVIEQVTLRVDSMDVLPQQVEVNVKILQITRETGKQVGIDWNTVLSISGAARPTNLPFGPGGGRFLSGDFPDPLNTDFVYGTLSATDLSAVLRLVQESTDAEVISEPNLTTLDNIEASILIGQKFPVTTETIDPQTAVRTVTLDYYEDIGIQLLVVPSISEGNRVHLVIHPAVSTVSELVEGRFPIIETREADTQVVLKSGETVVIGGLVEKRVDEVSSKIPFLGDIPFLGRLFQYTSKQERTLELVILVTPRIVLETQDYEESLLLSPDKIDRLQRLRLLFDKVDGR